MNWISLLKIQIVILIYIFISITICELFLRFVFTPELVQMRIDANSYNSDKDTLKGNFIKSELKFKPFSKAYLKHVEYKHEVLHDEFGYRNPCFDKEKHTDGFLIGDSFVYGTGLLDLHVINCQMSQDLQLYTIGIPGASPLEYKKLISRAKQISKVLKTSSKPTLGIAIYAGNDFEGLQLIGNDSFKSIKEEKREGYFYKLAEKINIFYSKNEFLKNSYFLSLIKITALPFFVNHEGNYVRNGTGDTIYKQTNNYKKLTNDIRKGLNSLKIEAIRNDFDLNYLLIIPAAVDISKARLERDKRISRFENYEIDINIKYNIIFNICNQLSIKCIDIRNYLTNEDYYERDNHLKFKGIKKISSILIQEINDFQK